VPFLLCLGMILVPVLVLGGGRGGAKTTNVIASASPFGASTAAWRSVDQPFGDLAGAPNPSPPDAQVAANAPAVPAAPPRPAVVHHTATVTLSHTVARRVIEPATTAAPRPSQSGPASWYPAPTGTCAHPSLPIGTIVTVTDIASGRSTTCRVADRGPYEGGRIIDLSEGTFAQLASPSSGVIEVRITW
jgi:rare lipoprotein A (peptidoglycan hydrolase)